MAHDCLERWTFAQMMLDSSRWWEARQTNNWICWFIVSTRQRCFVFIDIKRLCLWDLVSMDFWIAFGFLQFPITWNYPTGYSNFNKPFVWGRLEFILIAGNWSSPPSSQPPQIWMLLDAETSFIAICGLDDSWALLGTYSWCDMSNKIKRKPATNLIAIAVDRLSVFSIKNCSPNTVLVIWCSLAATDEENPRAL